MAHLVYVVVKKESVRPASDVVSGSTSGAKINANEQQLAATCSDEHAETAKKSRRPETHSTDRWKLAAFQKKNPRKLEKLNRRNIDKSIKHSYLHCT